MKKTIIPALFLSMISIGAAFSSSWTAILSEAGNSVQCNRWGWVDDHVQTVWKNSCTPFEVKSLDGSKVFSIPTTAKQCQDNYMAVYRFTEGDRLINFVGCYFVSGAQFKTDIKK